MNARHGTRASFLFLQMQGFLQNRGYVNLSSRVTPRVARPTNLPLDRPTDRGGGETTGLAVRVAGSADHAVDRRLSTPCLAFRRRTRGPPDAERRARHVDLHEPRAGALDRRGASPRHARARSLRPPLHGRLWPALDPRRRTAGAARRPPARGHEPRAAHPATVRAHRDRSVGRAAAGAADARHRRDVGPAARYGVAALRIACSTARATSRRTDSTCASIAPVAATIAASPSNCVCAGSSARAKPSCADCAARRHSPLVSRALVATATSVVL